MDYWVRQFIVLVIVAMPATAVLANEPPSRPGANAYGPMGHVQGPVGHVQGPVGLSPWDMPAGTAIWAMPPQSPHRVIRQPPILSAEEQKEKAQREWLGAPPANVERAAVAPVWRQPYAYGYFGAQPQRHWQRHFGWNKAYTQWTLK